MGRCIDCHAAIVPWGVKAKFRRARIGIFRRDREINLAVITNSGIKERFPIQPGLVELLPAAIRFREFKLDVFVKEYTDQHYQDMKRAIEVILKQEQYRQAGKTEKIDRFLGRIPLLSELPETELIPKLSRDEDRLNNKSIRIITIRNVFELPTLLWQRKEIQELTLNDCNLNCVPKELEAFSLTLTTLDLSSNKIDKLPRTFCCKMTKLKYLHLKDNRIEILPIEIKFLSSLFDLNIANNRLRMIPSTFSDLKSLKYLNVANNNLSQLPAFRNDDISLESLDVSHNPLDGASDRKITFEVHPSIYDETLQYNICPLNTLSKNEIPKLFNLTLLSIVSCDKLLKLASETPLPQTIVYTMQRDIFKCYRCRKMSILPAYNSTDTLDYVNQVKNLYHSNYDRGMTFMKLLCGNCFDKMSF